MSEAFPEDWQKTCVRDLTRRNPGTNWLGHQLGSQTALIDEMILSGNYTVDDIAQKLVIKFLKSTNDHEGWLFRIGRHVAHLEWENDGGGIPHGLVVKEDNVTGKLSFDCCGVKPSRSDSDEDWNTFNAREFNHPQRR